MSKPLLKVKKQGNVVTVFVDPTTDRPISTQSFDDEPVGGFPKVYDVYTAQESFPEYQMHYVEGPSVTPPEADVYAVTDELVEETDRKAKEQIQLAAEKRALKSGKPLHRVPDVKPSLGVSPVHTRAPNNPELLTGLNNIPTLPNQLVTELRTMLAKRQVATGKVKREIDSEVNHVFNFILRVFPQSREQLTTLSAEYREAKTEVF